jgi:nicotinamidase-related amidase
MILGIRFYEKTGMLMKMALLVIDLQRWYLERGHLEKLSRVETLIAKTNALIDFFHKQRLPVVQVRLIHRQTVALGTK